MISALLLTLPLPLGCWLLLSANKGKYHHWWVWNFWYFVVVWWWRMTTNTSGWGFNRTPLSIRLLHDGDIVISWLVGGVITYYCHNDALDCCQIELAKQINMQSSLLASQWWGHAPYFANIITVVCMTCMTLNMSASTTIMIVSCFLSFFYSFIPSFLVCNATAIATTMIILTTLTKIKLRVISGDSSLVAVNHTASTAKGDKKRNIL